MSKLLSAPANFRFNSLILPGAWLIEPIAKRDDRGFFARTFCAEEFARFGLETSFVQRSVSFNARRGTLRGLHFQESPHVETKIVRCTRGAIFDVIVDLRPEEPSFRRFVQVDLRADRANMLYVPPGCAHGFLTLEDASEVYYEITPAYRPEASTGIRWDDPDLAIPWPFQPVVTSERDEMLPTSRDYFARRIPVRHGTSST
jgi:dTDP-4-dehydrorhamnose 3,5-epimerase